jgi:hypothetical protein
MSIVLSLVATSSALCAAWVPLPAVRPIRSQPLVARTSVLNLKKAPDETPEERPQVQISDNAIVEFNDPKHGSGAAPSILGLVKGVEYKAKGGARIQIMDANGAMHTVPEKDIHVNLGSYKGKLQETGDILKEYHQVMELEATQLGVDPELLEMAWELAAETDQKSHTSKFLMSLVDEGFFKSQLDSYKAFRLLTSDMGRIFFKSLNGNEYKAKAAKAVKASKENWCKSLKGEEEWCFV